MGQNVEIHSSHGERMNMFYSASNTGLHLTALFILDVQCCILQYLGNEWLQFLGRPIRWEPKGMLGKPLEMKVGMFT